MITGTNHFVSREAAFAYYSGAYKFTRQDVRRKIASKEIKIGKPALKNGEMVLINKVEGRYFKETP